MRKRTIPVMLYLSAEENEQLNYDLHRTGLKKSQYLRALIMKQEIRERLPIDYYHMLTEISRIGNNINQIARIANQHPDAMPDLAHTLYLIQHLYGTTVECVQHTHQSHANQT